MTCIVIVEKDGEVVIGADSRWTANDVVMTTKNPEKIISKNGQHFALSGYGGLIDMFKASLVAEELDENSLSNETEIYLFLTRLHKRLKEEFYLKPEESTNDQPLESSQSVILIANKSGIYRADSYRSVLKIDRFWAIGSGMEFALGAMEATYNQYPDALGIAREGIATACKFDAYCTEPIQTVEIDES